MAKPLTFQQVILRLQAFWADHSCVVWQPYSEKLGAGTMNPATVLRVLGPEPWNVGYVEPSYRPADGRYGENPNRMQYYYQYQVILKPDPGNPQELYLESLYDLGLRREEHDIRFVEDNWEAPGLGAWGLGWEVWLDGQEITQFTYFQQAGGYNLDPVSVEITYGLERIAMYLQDVRSVWEINWDGVRTYGDYLLDSEVDGCRYNFEYASVERLIQMYDLFEAEARDCLAAGLVIPAHDYILRCSHTFNLLDARGAVGVTERATYFRRMRDLFRYVAQAYVEKREGMAHPWLVGAPAAGKLDGQDARVHLATLAQAATVDVPTTFLLEIGVEELPAGDLDAAMASLHDLAPQRFEEARLDFSEIRVFGTPRRLVLLIEGLGPRQRPVEELAKGPPARDAEGQPTRAAEGFARRHGVAVDALEVREMDGGEYVVAMRREAGRHAAEVLAELLPDLIASLRFQKSMRWNQSNVAFSRPIRWLVCLMGEAVVPFEFAGVSAGRQSRGHRADGSPIFDVPGAAGYLTQLAEYGIVADPAERRSQISAQARRLAQQVGGSIPDDPVLLSEVANLVEQPTALLGQFAEEYLRLPSEVLIAVMKKHQRYFPVVGSDGELMPHFVTVRNGGSEHLATVQRGNQEVIRARFADAAFFFDEDTKQPLEAFLPRLGTLTFQERLGSMLDKSRRLERLVPQVSAMLGLSAGEATIAERAAHLCKADLATQMVVELTSLQGVMGREYALRSGEQPAVSQAIFGHYLPRGAADGSPETQAGLAVGLADRLDSLAGLFAAGLTPSGSSDPYQLRRQALGIVQNLVAHQASFSLERGLAAAASFLPLEASRESVAGAADFVVERLRGYLRDRGFGFDVVDAVLAARGDDPYAALVSVEELDRWIRTDGWPRILDNYARCVRITRSHAQSYGLDPTRFEQPAEIALYSAYSQARQDVGPDGSVDGFLNAFAPLVDMIDAYFARESGVLVMAEDLKLRENRLAQLQHIAALADGIVDLSRLEGF